MQDQAKQDRRKFLDSQRGSRALDLVAIAFLVGMAIFWVERCTAVIAQ